MNDISTTEEQTTERSKLQTGLFPRDSIEEFWKAFELKQCELMQESGIALSKILRKQAA